MQTLDGATQSYALAGPKANSLMAISDGQGGTDIVVCFASGTRIRAVRRRGIEDVAVESLAVGDLVVTALGAHRPIRWLGHRAIDYRRHPRPSEVMPVRIVAHAFGAERPARDLYVSPGHSICVDVMGQVLIPASALVDGAAVTQVEVDKVTYWHVELDSHDILIADGLPAESYLAMGNRSFFAESDVVALGAAPDGGHSDILVERTHAAFCRPFHAHGSVVEAVRARLRTGGEKLRRSAQDTAHADMRERRTLL